MKEKRTIPMQIMQKWRAFVKGLCGKDKWTMKLQSKYNMYIKHKDLRLWPQSYSMCTFGMVLVPNQPDCSSESKDWTVLIGWEFSQTRIDDRIPSRRLQVSVIAQENLMLAAFLFHHRWRCTLDWEVRGVSENTGHLLAGQKRLEDEYKDPDVLPKVNKADRAGTI